MIKRYLLAFVLASGLVDIVQAAPVTYKFDATVTTAQQMSYFSTYTGLDYSSVAVGDNISGSIFFDLDLLPTSVDPTSTTTVSTRNPSDQWLILSLEDGIGNSWSATPNPGELFNVQRMSAESNDSNGGGTSRLFNGLNFSAGAAESFSLRFSQTFPNVSDLFDNLLSLTLVNQVGDATVCAHFSCALTEPIGSVQFNITEIYQSPVPIPAAIWLFGSGLLGLIGLARRKA